MITLTYTFANETEVRAHLAGTTATAPAEPEPVAESTVSVEPVAEPTAPTADQRDADGMPFDPDVHQSPPSLTAAGTWRAARGKADEASAARAAFKAAGAGVTLDVAAAAPKLPGAAPKLPGMPTPDAPAPITLDAFVERIGAIFEAGRVTAEQLNALYEKHSGRSGDDAFDVFETNESARRNLLAELDV